MDILVANARRARAHARLEETTDALWDEMMRVNLNGAFYAFRAAIGGMSERGWGRPHRDQLGLGQNRRSEPQRLPRGETWASGPGSLGGARSGGGRASP